MLRQLFTATLVVTALTGCASNMQNPMDRFTYRSEPLVKDVSNGMSQDRVLTIGGEPSRVNTRSGRPGVCHDYVLSRDGNEQVYYVSFDGSGRVDGKGFLSCAQFEENQRDRH